jgi:hypothetical protein
VDPPSLYEKSEVALELREEVQPSFPLISQQSISYPHREDVRTHQAARTRFQNSSPNPHPYPDSLTSIPSHQFALRDVFELATQSTSRYKATVEFFHQRVIQQVEREQLLKKVKQIKENFEENFQKWLARVKENHL